MPNILCTYRHVCKSTHTDLLRFQAATAHSFHLPEDLALQSVTSVPAKSLGLEHRIGYLRPGYDADIVVWDSHPLSVGATPSQVYIDGRATLDPIKVTEGAAKVSSEVVESLSNPIMRAHLEPAVKEEMCNHLAQGRTFITGITKSYLKVTDQDKRASENLTMVLDSGKVVCFNSGKNCISHSSGAHVITFQDGHVSPGLTALSTSLGMIEIAMEGQTGDGGINRKLNPSDPNNLVFAKYGVHLEGRAFERAMFAGITRAISAPLNGGFSSGVSVGIKTSGKQTILDGGIFRDDIAVHFAVGQGSKSRFAMCVSVEDTLMSERF